MINEKVYNELRTELIRIFALTIESYRWVDLKALEIEVKQHFHLFKFSDIFYFWDLINSFNELDFITHNLKEKTITYDEILKLEKIYFKCEYPKRWEFSIPRYVMGTSKILSEYEKTKETQKDLNNKFEKEDKTEPTILNENYIFKPEPETPDKKEND